MELEDGAFIGRRPKNGRRVDLGTGVHRLLVQEQQIERERTALRCGAMTGKKPDARLLQQQSS